LIPPFTAQGEEQPSRFDDVSLTSSARQVGDVDLEVSGPFFDKLVSRQRLPFRTSASPEDIDVRARGARWELAVRSEPDSGRIGSLIWVPSEVSAPESDGGQVGLPRCLFCLTEAQQCFGRKLNIGARYGVIPLLRLACVEIPPGYRARTYEEHRFHPSNCCIERSRGWNPERVL
jgi:hypothetical protein